MTCRRISWKFPHSSVGVVWLWCHLAEVSSRHRPTSHVPTNTAAGIFHTQRTRVAHAGMGEGVRGACHVPALLLLSLQRLPVLISLTLAMLLQLLSCHYCYL